MWRRRGCTGTSTPASRATVAPTGPAALITRGVDTVPSVVATPVMRSPARSIVVTRTPSTMRAPRSRARRAKPLVTSAGRLRRGAAADRLALEHQHVAHAAPGEVVGDGAADHATTDDHGAGGAGKGHDGGMLPDRHGTVAVATSRCQGYRLGCVHVGHR